MAEPLPPPPPRPFFRAGPSERPGRPPVPARRRHLASLLPQRPCEVRRLCNVPPFIPTAPGGAHRALATGRAKGQADAEPQTGAGRPRPPVTSCVLAGLFVYRILAFREPAGLSPVRGWRPRPRRPAYGQGSATQGNGEGGREQRASLRPRPPGTEGSLGTKILF